MNNDELYNFITDRVCELFGITETVLKSNSKKHTHTKPRHVWHWILKVHLGWGLTRIGALSKRDHATISNSIDVIYDGFDLANKGYEETEYIKHCRQIVDELYYKHNFHKYKETRELENE